MPARYCGNKVIGASFGCTVVVCILFAAAPVVITVCSLNTIGEKATPFVYIPVYILAIAIIIVYMMTTLTDPGVMPKRKITLEDKINNGQYELETIPLNKPSPPTQRDVENNINDDESAQEKVVQNQPLEAQVNQQRKIRATNHISAKFNQQPKCPTCGVERPPGSAHCSDCDHCVLFQDHHCPWMGTCIGLRNYFYFVASTISTAIYCIIVVAFCGAGLYMGITFPDMTGKNNYIYCLIQGVFLVMAVFGFFFGVSMCCSHFSLVKSDFTTRQELRHRLNVHQTLDQTSQMNDKERKEFVQQLIAEDPVLRTLDMKKYKDSGVRRMFYGRKMPILRNMTPKAAEEVAWRWTVVLGGFDDTQ
ncbi:DHHC_palmitoyltransferase [Hexamita inflata]|uniref:Palmitoyltransferase n=1 Tax=Hexamita inflata TaxID=28002 RepID=A0AA86UXY8_9EUKA|nr:DHHC palmitoyltransferase [Hexamita inflata]